MYRVYTLHKEQPQEFDKVGDAMDAADSYVADGNYYAEVLDENNKLQYSVEDRTKNKGYHERDELDGCYGI